MSRFVADEIKNLMLSCFGAARPLNVSDRLTWTSSEGQSFYFGGFAAMQ